MKNFIIKLGDISKQETKAIVNSANPSLLAGSGVSGAIHFAAGRELEKECKRIREDELGGNLLENGKAILTKGYDLLASHVIHVSSPVWNGGSKREEELLEQSYLTCLQMAEENGLESISFPSLSTGIYRFPIEKASRIAIQTINAFLEQSKILKEVRMVLFRQEDLMMYQNVFNQIKNEK